MVFPAKDISHSQSAPFKPPLLCLFKLYELKSISEFVKFTISKALLFDEPSKYSEKNNSVAVAEPLVVVPLTGVESADLLPTSSTANTCTL